MFHGQFTIAVNRRFTSTGARSPDTLVRQCQPPMAKPQFV